MKPPSVPRIDIREVTPADADAVARLSAELGYPIDAMNMRARLEQRADRADHGVYVASRQQTALGWIHVSAVHHLQSEPRAEIGGLIVTADARSGGIGRMLVAREELWATEHGVASVLVRSQIMREAAHRFYQREGYARTKTSAVFSKTLENTQGIRRV